MLEVLDQILSDGNAIIPAKLSDTPLSPMPYVAETRGLSGIPALYAMALITV
jgi:hypothetical protein